ncbi:AbrB/MazE/SpoVT family DNA-binding domain-containing protein [Clostridium sp.]|uniref:AbrB/MazE/SpoVT family DNA-binding domain-containing protein n=1 Tax=Clostridium sp. TaxID=1506 RepID=UPI00283E795E|nr:AbrB/MazE/SpoVT family DNA-binding domain-containing protein [Clostridium sp.]MDR3595143.1 AbrB/MazE/SpoVT family DNA-binding domain-containing protein [Clostridium sp.]
MKATGIVRNVDPLGRVVIPKELRKVLKINENDPMEIFVEGEDIILRKHQVGCHCCGEMKDLTNVLGLDICPTCLAEFKKAAAITDKLRKVD